MRYDLAGRRLRRLLVTVVFIQDAYEVVEFMAAS
ncbi:hypothetical protein COLO4_15447 [Corchorus olitorius]|uniref:Uncharacterized protein n=1 Tax=Corchorus olitorius TaxID=93759 RepID=A0A1R3JMV2_9ROSI|nr:hypothetical protein COLO4_15447 [Corchorus olitorius]